MCSVDFTGLLGDIKEDWGSGDGSPPVGSRGGAPVEGLGTKKLKLHIIFALKDNNNSCCCYWIK